MLQGFSKRSLWYQRACGCLPCSQRCLSVRGGVRPAALVRALDGDTASSASVNPARIERVRTELPRGYEVAALSGRAAPVAFWGLGPGWTADPPRCGVLADPVADAATTRGWSASGPGGIVYAVVAGSDARRLDPVAARRMRPVDGVGREHHRHRRIRRRRPPIDGAATVGMATATTTVVEGGTETPFARGHVHRLSAATTSRSSPSSAIPARRILHSDRNSRRNCW